MVIAAKMDLRRALFLFQALVAAGALVMMFTVKHGDTTEKTPIKDSLISAGLIMITNLGVVITFDCAYLVSPWLFPTVLLATAYGVLNVFGRAITMLSPIIAKLPHPWPLVILIVYAGLGALLSFGLRKTQ